MKWWVERRIDNIVNLTTPDEELQYIVITTQLLWYNYPLCRHYIMYCLLLTLMRKLMSSMALCSSASCLDITAILNAIGKLLLRFSNNFKSACWINSVKLCVFTCHTHLKGNPVKASSDMQHTATPIRLQWKLYEQVTPAGTMSNTTG